MKAFDYEIATQKICKAMEGLTKDEQRNVLGELLTEDGLYKELTPERRAQLANAIAAKGGTIAATTSEDAEITDKVLKRKGYISSNAAALMVTSNQASDVRTHVTTLSKRIEELQAECDGKKLEMNAIIDELHSEGYTDDEIADALAEARLVTAAHDLGPDTPKQAGLNSHAAIPFSMHDFDTSLDNSVTLPKSKSVAVIRGRDGTKGSLISDFLQRGIEEKPDPDDPNISPGESFAARIDDEVGAFMRDMEKAIRVEAYAKTHPRIWLKNKLLDKITELGLRYNATPAQVRYAQTIWQPAMETNEAYGIANISVAIAWAKAEEFIPNIRELMAEFERRISKCVWPPNVNSPSNVEALCMAMGFCWSCCTLPGESDEERARVREQENNQKLLSNLISELSKTNDKFDLFIRKSRFIYDHPDLSTFALAWTENNFAKLEVGHKLAASLALTDIPDDMEVQAPWMAWSLVIPPDLFDKIGENDGSGALVDWARAFCYGSEVAFIVYSNGRVIGNIDRKKMIADEAIPTGKLLDNLVRGVCLALSEPEQFRKKKVGSSHTGNRRESGAPDLSNARYLLTAPVQVDLRDVLKAVQRGEKKGGKGWKLACQFLVRGHPKNQAYGPNMQLRKRIWVQPFWKGPKESRVLLRNYVMKDEEKGENNSD